MREQFPNDDRNCSCHSTTGPTIPAALANAPKTKTRTRTARSGRFPNRPMPERTGSLQRSLPGRSGQDADVFVGTGMNAVEAERTVHVARLPRLKQLHLTAGDIIPAADAVVSPACRADSRISDLHFERRDKRLHEVELADRANIFAEAGPTKEPVDDKGRHEVAQGDPRGPAWAIPESKRFIGPQETGRVGAPRAICFSAIEATRYPAGAIAGRASWAT